MQLSLARNSFIILYFTLSFQSFAAEVSISIADRAKLAQLVEPLDPSAASLLVKTGRIAGENLEGIGLFYLVSGAMAYSGCFQSKDDASCKAFSTSLKDPVALSSMAVFTAASVGGSQASKALFHAGPALMHMHALSGLVLAQIASQIFTEFFDNPLWKKYLLDRGNPDQGAREKLTAEDQKELFSKTFGDPDWYSANVPSLVSLLGGFSAPLLLGKLNSKVKENFPKNYSCAIGKLGEAAGVAVYKMPWLAHPITTRLGATAANIALFNTVSNALNPVAQKSWEEGTFFIRHMNNLRSIRKAEATGDEASIKSALAENTALWNDFRRSKLAASEQLMSTHMQEIGAFERQVDEPAAFYTWFSNHLPDPPDPSWSPLQNKFFSPYTTPSDIQKETLRYARSFFCGVDPDRAFHNPVSPHGVPIPFISSAQMTSYRVVSKVDPRICSQSDAQLVTLLKNGDYFEDWQNTKAAVEKTTYPRLQDLIDRYETAVKKGLLKSLQGTQGVIALFDHQFAELKTVADQAKTPNEKKMILDQITRLQAVKASAVQIVTILKTPDDQRTLFSPSQTAAAMQGISDSKDPMSEATQYFQSFIINNNEILQ